MNEAKSEVHESNESTRIPLLEWIVSGIGTLLVAASLAFLVSKAFAENEPPAFAVQCTHIVPVDGGYAANLKVKNTGGQTVASLVMQCRVENHPELLREVTVDYLPAKSSRTIALLFPRKPTSSSLQFTFLSYESP